MTAPRQSGSISEDLVRRAQNGEHDAFTTIVDHSIDRMFAVASLTARDPALAEDAVQNALLRAWRDLPTLRDPTRITAWLARLTINATYDVMRDRRRLDEIRPLPETVPSVDHMPGTVDRLLLSWAYGRLPVDQRAVVVLHYYLGLSLDEVAVVLDIPAGTARSRLHAALVSMRRWIGSDRSPSILAAPTEVVR